MNPLQVTDFNFLNVCLNQSRGVYTSFALASFAKRGLCYEHMHTWMEKQATWEKRGERRQHSLSKSDHLDDQKGSKAGIFQTITLLAYLTTMIL